MNLSSQFSHVNCDTVPYCGSLGLTPFADQASHGLVNPSLFFSKSCMSSRTLARQASALRSMCIDTTVSTALPPKLNEGHALPYTDFMINPVPIRVEKSFALSCSEMDRRHWLYACSQKLFLGALLFQPFSSIHLQKLHTTNKKKTYLTVSDIYRILRKRRVLTGQDLGRKREKS